MEDDRLVDLKEVYSELDENMQRKIEMLAEGLLNSQKIVDDEKVKLITKGE